MLANYNLIKILRDSAKYLKNNLASYDWNNTTLCNCGVVARVAINSLKEESFKEENKTYVTWSRMVDLVIESEKGNVGAFGMRTLNTVFCSTTGLTYSEVIKHLLNVGFEAEDFERLEFLKDSIYCNGIKNPNPNLVIDWLYKEANKLEEELISFQTKTLFTTDKLGVLL